VEVVTDIGDILEGRISNGIYRLGIDVAANDVGATIGSAGWRLVFLDGSAVTTKAEYLQAWCDEAEFPEWFGHNWDALADAASDLSWLHANGYVVLFDNAEEFATKSAADAATALEIMAEAAAHWASNGTPFIVLLR
jgi:hypothetical protein